MSYNLFIDDVRDPHWNECQLSGVDPDLDWVIVRSSQEAIEAVRERGTMPDRLALDHDLGEAYTSDNKMYVDETPRFLRWLAYEFFNPETMKVPIWSIHSANVVGVQRMYSFMKSWEKSFPDNLHNPLK